MTVRLAATLAKASGMAIVGMLLITCLAVSAAEAPAHQHAALPVDETFTLTEALDAAFDAYPAALELTARSAQAEAWTERGQSWLAGRPSATLRYQTDRWDSDKNLAEYEAGVLLPLWSWGGRSAVRQLGDALSVESSAADSALRWEVAGLVRSALWTIALAESDHELAEQVVDMAASLTASVERRHELGDVALGERGAADRRHRARAARARSRRHGCVAAGRRAGIPFINRPGSATTVSR